MARKVYYTWNDENKWFVADYETDEPLTGTYDTITEANQAWMGLKSNGNVNPDDMSDEELLKALEDGTTSVEHVENYGISSGEERVDPSQVA